MNTQPSVIIVGAGPSGLVCALLLVRAGIQVKVLEKETDLQEDMRASTFHPATLDLLTGTGVARSLLSQGTQVGRWQYLQHESGERIIFDLSLLNDVTGHPYRLQVEQFRLTRIIVDRLLDEPLFDIQFGAEVTEVSSSADGVQIEGNSAEGGQKWHCDWLIAADGGKSAVRKSLDLPFAGSVFPRTSITLLLDHPFQEDVENLLGVNYVWTAQGHYSLMRVRDLWRFSFSPADEEKPVEAHDRDAARERLQAVFPRQERYRLLQLNHYTLHQRCLEQFRHGRVVFCGDAAHLNSPAGGMGMNSGIHDAACQVDHLLPVLSGGDEALLDRYDRRRRTIATEEVQRLSARNYRRHRETNPQRRSHIWEKLKATAEDPVRAREFLLDSSMIQSLRREKSIE